MALRGSIHVCRLEGKCVHACVHVCVHVYARTRAHSLVGECACVDWGGGGEGGTMHEKGKKDLYFLFLMTGCSPSHTSFSSLASCRQHKEQG